MDKYQLLNAIDQQANSIVVVGAENCAKVINIIRITQNIREVLKLEEEQAKKAKEANTEAQEG